MSKTKMEKTEPGAFKKGKTGLDATLIDQWIAEHYEGPANMPLLRGLGPLLNRSFLQRCRAYGAGFDPQRTKFLSLFQRQWGNRPG